MSDEFKVQWSVSLPPVAQYAKGHMLNLRGETVDEVDDLLDAVLKKDGKFLVKAIEVGKVLLLAQGFNTPEPGDSGDSGPVDTTHTCQHGKREKRSGTKKDGGTWTGYFCPEKNKANQCDVQWAS